MVTTARTEAARTIIAGTDAALAELSVTLESADRVTLHGDDAHEWTAADVWGHVGRWLGVSAELIGRHLSGERDIHDYDGGGDQFNLAWIEEDRALDLESARPRALEAWGELRGLIADVEEPRWNRYIAAYANGNGVEHVLEHLQYVVEAAGVVAPPSALARLERDRAAWVAFVAALDARPDEALHDPESPDWTSREVFGHFARWTEHEVATFEAARDGRPAPSIDEADDVVNERWASEDRSLDLDAVRSRALRAFGARARLIASTAAERWTEEMEASVSAEGYDHIAEHHGYIGG